jgi:hypothetical protein
VASGPNSQGTIVTTKKTYTSFLVRIWFKHGDDEQGSPVQQPGDLSQTPDQPVTYMMTLIDLETGARIGFTSLAGLMAYLTLYTEPS